MCRNTFVKGPRTGRTGRRSGRIRLSGTTFSSGAHGTTVRHAVTFIGIDNNKASVSKEAFGESSDRAAHQIDADIAVLVTRPVIVRIVDERLRQVTRSADELFLRRIGASRAWRRDR